MFDGDVTVSGISGVSSWYTSTKKSDSGYTQSSITKDLSATIKIINKAKIVATSDYTSETQKNEEKYAYGIYLLCNGKGGKIDIQLKNGTISTAASSGTQSAEIKIQDFTGNATIVLSEKSSISATTGSGIYLKNCYGSMNICKDLVIVFSPKYRNHTKLFILFPTVCQSRVMVSHIELR